METEVVLFIVVIFFVIFLIFLVVISPTEEYAPVSTLGVRAPTSDELDLPAYYSAYLPINNNELNRLEKLVANRERNLTLGDLSKLTVNQTAAKAYLETLGQVLWYSPSGTYAVLKTTGRQLQEQLKISLSLTENDVMGLLNKPVTLSYGLVIDELNLWVDSSTQLLTPEAWSAKFDLLQQPLGNPPGVTANVINETSNIRTTLTPSGTPLVGIISSTVNTPVSRVALRQLAEDLNLDRDYFSSRIKAMIFDPTASPPFTESSINFVDQTLGEIFSNVEAVELNVDLQTIFATAPQSEVWVYFYGGQLTFLSDAYYGFNQMLPLWASFSAGPKVWSSSLDGFSKVIASDYERRSQEGRILSLAGISTFQRAGNFGIYPTFGGQSDVTRPDLMGGYFDTPYTIYVGGVSHSGGKLISMVDVSDHTVNDMLASGGGFARGYHNDPVYKQKNRQTYIANQSSPIAMNQQGDIVPFDLSIDQEGNIQPDIVNVANMSFAVGNGDWLTLAGNSISVHYSAATFLLLNQLRINNNRENFSLLSKILHQNPSLMDRVIQGRNNVYNLYGYPSSLTLPWDPVQGLGIPNIERFTAL